MSQNIMIFKNVIDSDYQTSIAGFKIVDTKLAKACIKLVQELAQNNISFDVQGTYIQYDPQKFDTFKLSSSDIHSLEKIFDFDTNVETGIFGIFPDILNDAYQNNILSDEQFEDLSYLDENE